MIINDLAKFHFLVKLLFSKSSKPTFASVYRCLYISVYQCIKLHLPPIFLRKQAVCSFPIFFILYFSRMSIFFYFFSNTLIMCKLRLCYWCCLYVIACVLILSILFVCVFIDTVYLVHWCCLWITILWLMMSI